MTQQHIILGPPVARPQPNGSNDDYISRQAAMDRRSEAAWKNAPKRFLKEAAKVGLDAGKVDYESASVAPYDPEFSSKETPYDPDYASRAYTPNMADLVDDYVDEMVEKIILSSDGLFDLDISQAGLAGLIRHIAEQLKKPVEEELARNRALLLGRIASYLVADEKGNILARIHALLHAIPRLAVENGYSSMRASALHCGASVEWLRKSRNKVCALLELDPPAHGVKTDEARAKYKTNAQNNHWRHQLYEAPTRKPNE